MRRSVWQAHRTVTCTISEMESLKLPSRSNPPNFSFRFQLLPRIGPPKTAKSSIQIPTNSSLGTLLSLASILLGLSCVLFVAFGFRFNLDSAQYQGKRYGIVIDGGSTGTRIHLFEYQNDGKTPIFESISKQNFPTMRIHPGLSAFEEDLDGARLSISRLLEFAKERIPKKEWDKTEIRLMATAGLRRLSLEAQSRILDACRSVLAASGFKFKSEWASVITGADEGIYAWVATNYALGALGGDPQKTTGIIELGGASAQVTFVSKDPPPPEFSRVLTVAGVNYTLYTNSLLHFGQNVAYESVRQLIASGDMAQSRGEVALKDPCMPRGYEETPKNLELLGSTSVEGATSKHVSIDAVGNFSKCRSAALTLLQKEHDQCSYQHCNVGRTYIPQLHGRFIATENFFYTSKFFGLAPSGLLSDIKLAGENFCAESWPNLKKKYQSVGEEDLAKYCFSSAYIIALLHDSLGVQMDEERFGFAIEVDGVPLEWALGAFIMQMDDNPNLGSNWLQGDELLRLFAMLSLAAVLIVIVWSASNWRKPQTKTIYDLEKGHYIVTRTGR